MGAHATDSFADVFGTKRGPTTETQRQNECLSLDELRQQRESLEADIERLHEQSKDLDVEVKASRERRAAQEGQEQQRLEEQFECERLQLVEDEEHKKDRRWAADHGAEDEAGKMRNVKVRTFKAVLRRRLRPAHRKDYEAWLSGYLATGEQSTHHYPYAFSVAEFYVATEDFVMRELYGSNAISVIVPSDVRWLGGQLGHCNLYFMDDFHTRSEGFTFVPRYEDLEV